MHACFVAIKYHIKSLDRSVMNAIWLSKGDISDMMTLIHQPLSTIYSKAQELVLAIDPLLNTMKFSAAVKFGEEFVQRGKGSTNHQCKVATSQMSIRNLVLHRSILAQFETFLIYQPKTDGAPDDVKFNLSEPWNLRDEAPRRSINGPLPAFHTNPTGSIRGKFNHIAAKRVQFRFCTQLDKSKVAAGTAIMFDSRQLDHLLKATENTMYFNKQ